jgi:anti-sigma28 factor (negative regulator of flagellin synthesis)
MNEVNGVNPARSTIPIGRRETVTDRPPVAPDCQTPQDQVEISEAGAMMAKLRELPDIRVELVARIRAEITAGTYETPERLQGAIERLIEDLT